MGRAVPAGSQDKDLGDAQEPLLGSTASKQSQVRGRLRSKDQMGKTTLHFWATDLPDTGLVC